MRDAGSMSDDYLDEETRRRFALQEPLSAAANVIFDAADEGITPGYTGIILDVEGGKVHVYWHGTIPARVMSAIATARDSVGVELHPAPHSRAELQQHVKEIVEEEEIRAVPEVFRAHGLSVEADGTGIVVYVEKIDADELLRRAHRPILATEIAGRMIPSKS